MKPYDEGFVIMQAQNSATGTYDYNSLGWFLLAGMDSGQYIDPEGLRTDLLLHSAPAGQYAYQTIWTIGDSDASSFLAYSSMALFATAALSMFWFIIEIELKK